MQPIRLVVVFGGQSAEHAVSCTTASHVLAAADPTHYSIEAIAITRSGDVVRADGAMEALAQGSMALPSSLVADGTSTDLRAAVEPTSADQRTVVLPLLHGPLGEDGTIQGLLELANVPYVGSGVLGSAVTMDKAMAKTVLSAAGIPQARWVTLFEHEDTSDAALSAIADELGFPIFVKPANMGSSIGVSRATDTSELRAGVDEALAYDDVLVLEEGIDGREVELAVLGNHEIRVSVPGEIRPAAAFYDYDDKYRDGAAELIIPAPLDDDVIDQLRELSEQAYRALRCEGMARADFLVEEGGRGPLLNELNTIPGFTPISMYPKLWEASGLAYAALIDELVRLAIERFERRAARRPSA
jgi:D-alanine-D-alanine ligase